jgi:hypothetical protein
VLLGWRELIVINEAGLFTALLWVSNPLWLIFFVTGIKKESRSSFYFSLAALLLGLLFFLAKVVTVSEAGGQPDPVTVYGFGFWLWLSSLVMAVAASFSLFRKSQK